MAKRDDIDHTLFGERLPELVEKYLHDTNPWWTDKPQRPLPPFRRWLFEHALRGLKTGLAPVVVLRGPRQVGKTTLQGQIIDHLLRVEGVSPRRILRVQFDEIPSLKGLQEPILSLVRWFQSQILGCTLNESAHKGEAAFLFFDEVQNLRDWAPQIKAIVDHSEVRVLVTGSSALRIERGRDSLAGRISTLDLGTLLLREIAELQGWGHLKPLIALNGLARLSDKAFWEELREQGIRCREIRDRAFEAFSTRGAYPIAQKDLAVPWEQVADQLNENIILRVIQHDLRVGERGKKRDENLLEEIFRLACRYAGQAPNRALFGRELKEALSANLGWQRVLAYLKFLNDTLLIRLVDPLELRLKKKKGQPKICLCDHSLRASWLQEAVPLTVGGLEQSPHLSDLAGHIAESVAGYFLGNVPALDVAWFPERSVEPEIDLVVTVGQYRIPVEIKYRHRIDSHRDTLGLRAFIEKTVYNAPFGVLVTLTDDIHVDDPRIVALPLSSLLLMR